MFRSNHDRSETMLSITFARTFAGFRSNHDRSETHKEICATKGHRQFRSNHDRSETNTDLNDGSELDHSMLETI